MIDQGQRDKLAANWLGEGIDLAQRIVELADQLRQETMDAAVKQDIANDLVSILRKEWDPREQSR